MQVLTAIVAIKHNGRVLIGGDSAGVAGLQMSIRRDRKVFKVGEFAIGYTSSFRMGQVLQYHLDPPKGRGGMRYMVGKFVPHVRELLKKHGYAKVDNNVESGGFFIVGHAGEIYMVQSDFQVSRTVDGFDACGCGEDLILGSLHTTSKMRMTARQRATMALRAAERFSAGVRGPFHFVEV